MIVHTPVNTAISGEISKEKCVSRLLIDFLF